MGFDAKKAEAKTVSFLRSYFAESGRKTAVVGLSGGLDSAVALALCVRALGKKSVVAVLLPSHSTPKKDMDDAKALAKKLGVKTFSFNIGKMVASFGSLSSDRLSRANVSARVRMIILYSIAGERNGLVVGTGDKSEFLLGYFTKYGDGGADLFPLADIYKTEVRILARHLGIPDSIANKPSSPALWKGQTAENELGFSYEVADEILQGIEKGAKKQSLIRKFGKKAVLAVLQRMEKNRHKLLPAPVCRP